MIKTLAKAQQQERVKFRVPRSVQDAIPIRRIWSDGIFLCGNHERTGRLRSDPLRRQSCAVHEQLPDRHQALPPDDDQAG